ncbi:hypothetical protein [Filimonas effusa]|uniref:Uncharacterized protein n=1 Tax=Filimonas effusa TaxID=2508721 RepID=A0A4Q1DBG1_9BACT|nr:hypothetical protein [Filimonas effusa]RXK86791.1 hypothetical protein ESB13_08330 [Filimonas effusa]
MRTGIDTQMVRDHYQRMTNEELIRTATQDAAGLTPEARDIVREELEKRRLDTSIFKAVQAQNQSLTMEELDKYCEIIRSLDCPVCQASYTKLNATMTSEVMSLLIFTQWSKKLKIACPGCLDKANNDALLKSALTGWWGFPWGLIRTPIAIARNIKNKKTNHLDTPNDFLRSFTMANIGLIERYKEDKAKLQQVIMGK